MTKEIEKLIQTVQRGERLSHEEIGFWLLNIERRLQKKEVKKHGE